MSRTYWIARSLRSFGYAGLILCGWVLFVQFVNGRAEPAPKVCLDDCPCFCGPAGEAPEVLAVIFFAHFGGWSLALLGINLARAFGFLFRSNQPQTATRPFPAAVSVNPHFMESRNWGKTLPVLSRPFLGEFLTENPRVSTLGWIGRTLLSFYGMAFFAWLTVQTAIIGASDHRNFIGYDPCEGPPANPIAPQWDMDSFVNYTLFVVFLGITIVLIGQTRDFLRNAWLARTSR